MKRPVAVLALMILIPFFLSSCISINDVDQDSSGTLGVPFVSTVTTVLEWSNNTVNTITGNPVFAVKLPQLWEVVSCTAVYNSVTYICDTEDPDHLAFLPPDPDGTWQSFRMFDDVIGPQILTKGDVIVVTWTIRPASIGEFELDYWASILANSYPQGVPTYYSNVLANLLLYNPFDHPISIAAPPPVPTLNEYAMLILAGLLVFASMGFLKSKRDKKMKMPYAAILAVLGSALMLFSQCIVNEALATEPLSLTPENIRLIADTENPREAILNTFDWSEEERQWLEANLPNLSDQDLQAALQVFKDSENPENIRCMITNTESPKLECIDCTGLSEE